MSKLISMVKKNNKDVTCMLIIVFVLVMVSMLLINRGTYSVDENVNTDILVRICKALNCDTSDIMEIELDQDDINS